MNFHYPSIKYFHYSEAKNNIPKSCLKSALVCYEITYTRLYKILFCDTMRIFLIFFKKSNLLLPPYHSNKIVLNS